MGLNTILLRLRLRRSRRWGPAERRTLGIGVVAGATTTAVFATELARVWRRGSAPLPADADDLLEAAEEAVAETALVARSGYRGTSSRENALFNLLASFVLSFALIRGVTYSLRGRDRWGPFRNVRVGRRHIHHFVPGIVMAFASGAVAVATRDESLPPKLAVPMGVGMGLTLDESALLLELEDVYWTREGLVSVQITLATAALMAALALGLRVLRRGERLVLGPEAEGAARAEPAEAPSSTA
ncbi:MAG: hypothetical protein ACR2NV_04605 [Thermoleophilaceae bacterium]